MRASVWKGTPFHVSIENVPKPKLLSSEDAVVRLTSAAKCGTDLHSYQGIAPIPLGCLDMKASGSWSQLARQYRTSSLAIESSYLWYQMIVFSTLTSSCPHLRYPDWVRSLGPVGECKVSWLFREIQSLPVPDCRQLSTSGSARPTPTSFRSRTIHQENSTVS